MNSFKKGAALAVALGFFSLPTMADTTECADSDLNEKGQIMAGNTLWTHVGKQGRKDRIIYFDMSRTYYMRDKDFESSGRWTVSCKGNILIEAKGGLVDITPNSLTREEGNRIASGMDSKGRSVEVFRGDHQKLK